MPTASPIEHDNGQLTEIRPRVGNLLRLLQLSALKREFGSSRRQVVVVKHRIITVLTVVAFQVHTTSTRNRKHGLN